MLSQHILRGESLTFHVRLFQIEHTSVQFVHKFKAKRHSSFTEMDDLFSFITPLSEHNYFKVSLKRPLYVQENYL